MKTQYNRVGTKKDEVIKSWKHKICSFLPTEHLDVVECWVILERGQLLETQLLTASIETIRAINTDAVVIASSSILHRTQTWGTLRGTRLFLNERWSQFHIVSSFIFTVLH